MGTSAFICIQFMRMYIIISLYVYNTVTANKMTPFSKKVPENKPMYIYMQVFVWVPIYFLQFLISLI